jgi:hypothetical protein
LAINGIKWNERKGNGKGKKARGRRKEELMKEEGWMKR